MNEIRVITDDDEPDTSLIEPLTDPGSDTPPAVTTAVVATELPASPLRLPAQTADPSRAAVLSNLRGFSSSPDFLPSGLSPALDAIRERHRQLVGLAAGILDAITEAQRAFRAEDRAFEAAQAQAVRDGAPAADQRTSDGARYAAVKALEERLWPVLVVLSEVVGEAVAEVERTETDILNRLRGELGEASDQRREAERLIAEARQQEFLIDRVARWVRGIADGGHGPWARQPRPLAEPAPPSFDADGVLLERPWWQQRVVA